MVMLFFSLGCGIGYGYLHRIPIWTKDDETTDKKRKPSGIPNPPVIKPNMFPHQNPPEAPTNLANSFSVNLKPLFICEYDVNCCSP